MSVTYMVTDHNPADRSPSALTGWTGEQEGLLGTAASEFEEFNGRNINVLATFYRKSRPEA